MTTMTQLIKVLIRRWWLILLPVAVVAIYLVATYQPPPRSYQVVIKLAAGGHPSDTLSPDYDRYYAWLSSEYIANSLADIATSRRFVESVSQRLSEQDVTATPSQIQGSIASDNTQSISLIYLTWHNPDELQILAEAVSDTLIENGADFFPQMQNIGPVARVLDMPSPYPIAPSIRAQLLGPGLRLMSAAATGFGLALIAHYMDPFVRSEDEVEALKITVLARVPRS